jgi:hypothetical protein
VGIEHLYLSFVHNFDLPRGHYDFRVIKIFKFGAPAGKTTRNFLLGEASDNPAPRADHRLILHPSLSGLQIFNRQMHNRN